MVPVVPGNPAGTKHYRTRTIPPLTTLSNTPPVTRRLTAAFPLPKSAERTDPTPYTDADEAVLEAAWQKYEAAAEAEEAPPPGRRLVPLTGGRLRHPDTDSPETTKNWAIRVMR